MYTSMQYHLRRRKSWSTVYVVVGLVLALGARFVIPIVLTIARSFNVQLHSSPGLRQALVAAGIALATYGYFRPLRCPVCGKAIRLDEDEGDDVPGFCPNCDANLHKPMPDRPSAPIP